MKLHLFTANYPTGFGESFLNNELPHLAAEFEEVCIYPYAKKESIQQAFKGEQKVVYHSDEKQETAIRLSDKILIFRILLIEWLGCSNKSYFLRHIRTFFATLKKAMVLANWIGKQGLNEQDVYYSFWMNEWALALAILRKKGKPFNFVFRVNGYDIYDERHPGNYLPFRYFVYSQALRIIPLSETSANYVKNKTKFSAKVKHSYFGTKDFGEVDQKERERFTVFTCSSAIPLKRLDKIARVLGHLDFELDWVHHGDGATIAEVEKELQKHKHIRFRHSKKVEDYYQVLEMQKRLAPDIFINLSTTEGLPITLMEAISFGTPILVNEVGSCVEFIRPFTGIMVGVDETEEIIAKKIAKFSTSRERYSREDIKAFWRTNFSAENNYKNFASELKQTFNGIKR